MLGGMTRKVSREALSESDRNAHASATMTMDLSTLMTSPVSPTLPFVLPRSSLFLCQTMAKLSPVPLNQLPGPAARLLPELLTFVFSFLRELEPTIFYNRDRSEYFLRPERRLGWIKCTHVCRAWRMVALDQAFLWNRISFEDRYYTWGLEMLKRSRRSHLSIHRMRPGLLLTRHAPLPPEKIVDAISQNAARLRALTIEQPSNDWEILEIVFGRSAPHLEELTLIAPSFEPGFIVPPRLLDGHAPCLRRVKLSDCYFVWPSIAFESVTHLDISRTPRTSTHSSVDQIQKSITDRFDEANISDFISPTCDFMLDALRCMPNLESIILSYAIPHAMSTSPATTPSDPVKLEKLVQLRMTEHFLTQCSWILEHIRAPNLSEIALKCGGPEEDGLADHRALLRFLSTALGTRPLDMLHASAASSCLKLQAWARRTDTTSAFAPADAFQHVCIPLFSLELSGGPRADADECRTTLNALCGALQLAEMRTLCVSETGQRVSASAEIPPGLWSAEVWCELFALATHVQSVYGEGAAGAALVDALADADVALFPVLHLLSLEHVDLRRVHGLAPAVAGEQLLGIARSRSPGPGAIQLRGCVVTRPVVDELGAQGVTLSLD